MTQLVERKWVGRAGFFEKQEDTYGVVVVCVVRPRCVVRGEALSTRGTGTVWLESSGV